MINVYAIDAWRQKQKSDALKCQEKTDRYILKYLLQLSDLYDTEYWSAGSHYFWSENRSHECVYCLAVIYFWSPQLPLNIPQQPADTGLSMQMFSKLRIKMHTLTKPLWMALNTWMDHFWTCKCRALIHLLMVCNKIVIHYNRKIFLIVA